MSTNPLKLYRRILIGILFIVFGVIWIITGTSVGHLFFIPFVLIIMGVIIVVQGIRQKTKQTQQPDTSQTLDDNKDLDAL